MVLVIVDQWTKYLALNSLSVGESVAVFPYVNLTLTSNPGGAFSLLSDQGGWQRWFFIGISTIVSGVLFVWLQKLRHHQVVLALALSLILGGAVGNLWDRVSLGQVTDYVDAYYVRDFYGEDLADGYSVGSVWQGYLYRGAVYHDGDYHDDAYYRGWHWPAFNVADSAIFIGAILLFMVACRSETPGN